MQPYINQITTTDAHVSGEPIRVIASDALNLEGNSIVEKRDYFSSHLDYLRQALILEPRGHENMFGHGTIGSDQLPCELVSENLSTLIPEAMAIKKQAPFKTV